jgi:hypothetical protein
MISASFGITLPYTRQPFVTKFERDIPLGKTLFLDFSVMKTRTLLGFSLNAGSYKDIQLGISIFTYDFYLDLCTL